MQVQIAPIEGNIGTRKTTLLQKFEQSLSLVSSEDKVTIKVEHEPVRAFQSFSENELINQLDHFYIHPTDNAFIFQNYALDVYLQRMETLEIFLHP